MKNKTNKMMLLSAVMVTSMTLTGCSLQPHLELTSETQSVELGAKYDVKLEDWVGKEANQHILETTKMDTSKVKTDKVGKYPVEFSYTTKYTNKEETATGYVEVKDTTKPKFVDFKKQIKVEQNAQSLDMPKYFKATDVSGDVEIETDCKETVDFKKVGKYTMKVKATDKNKNSTEKECEVEVIDSKKINTKTLGELTAYVVPDDAKEGTKPQIPVSEATETKIVEGKIDNKAVQPVATKGVEVSKGKYSTSEKQKAYEKKLAEEKKKKEEAKKKAEAEKRAREEAQRKAEQQAQQQAYQDSFSEVYNQTQTYQPAYTQPTYTQPSTPTQQGSSGSSTTTTHKPAPITKPQACSVPSGYYYSRDEAISVAESRLFTMSDEEFDSGNGFYINQTVQCGKTVYYIVWK